MPFRRGIGGKNGGVESVYPELYAVVGSRVPDYRGMFLRGTGGNAASLGVQQGDAIRNITAYMGLSSYISPDVHPQWKSPSLSATGAATNTSTYPSMFFREQWLGGTAIHNLFFDASRVVPTAYENRPVNKAVRYLIRAKS